MTDAWPTWSWRSCAEPAPNLAVIGNAPRRHHAVVGLPLYLTPRVVNHGKIQAEVTVNVLMDLLTEETRARLTRLADYLASETDWSPTPLTAALRAFAAADGVGLGKFGAPLRAVLSGGLPAPDLAGALTALGRDESLGRIADALSRGE